MEDKIRIQSSVTIRVTNGLGHEDFTKKDSDMPNRLKVQPTWTRNMVLIREGVGEYPSEISEWPSVKSLVKKGVLTIGSKVSVVDVEVKSKEEAPKKEAKKSEKKAESLEDLLKEGE